MKMGTIFDFIYVLCSIYSALFVVLAIIIFFTEICGPSSVGRLPLAITGWTSYFIIDSYGSLVVALFWSFTNSIRTDDSAKRGFPLVNTFAHLGPKRLATLLGTGSLSSTFPGVIKAFTNPPLSLTIE